MKYLNPMLMCDYYKLAHKNMYPEGTEVVYSTWTARTSRLAGIDHIVWFGMQAFIKTFLISFFNEQFFGNPLDTILADYKRIIRNTLGVAEPETEHIEALWHLGYLPFSIKALPEGSLVPLRCPMMSVQNTHPEFFWLTNYIESLMSCELWQACTSATIAHEYRKILDKAAMETVGNTGFVQFQGHDFSFRGQSSLSSGISSGMGHLLSFVGTDTVPAIQGAEEFYNADVEKELVGTSIPACYDAETEVLTENGWRYFRDLVPDERVAQYCLDSCVQFVAPTKYHNSAYTGEMIRFSAGPRNYADMLVTPNHRMLRKSISKKTMEIFEADDHRYHFRGGYSSKNEMVISGTSPDGVGMTAVEKLKVAFQADGSYPSHAEDYTGERTGCMPIRFNLKKERKRARLIELCTAARIEFTCSERSKTGYYSFWVKPTEAFLKTLEWVKISQVSQQWADDFIAELQHWDGYKHTPNTTTYTSTVRSNIDVVQAICAISGRKTQYNASTDPRGDRQEIFALTILEGKTTIFGTGINKTKVPYTGTIHCVSVPSGLLIVRRNNTVCISGNSEHSVESAYGNDYDYFLRLISVVHPSGFVSIVSDGYDFWDVIGRVIPSLKDVIMAREGRLVCRPDSGDPVLIVCGDPNGATELERKGAIEALWDTFGGTVSEQGYKILDSHIGLIYGDALTRSRVQEICDRLASKGFASINCVCGMGSFEIVYTTRDTFGFAMKSTLCVINGKEKQIFKDPKTDDGTKKSQKGRVVVFKHEGDFIWHDGLGLDDNHPDDCLVEVFRDGKLLVDQSFAEVRAVLTAG